MKIKLQGYFDETLKYSVFSRQMSTFPVNWSSYICKSV